MFIRRNLLLELRVMLGQAWFQYYVIGSWTSGSNDDLVNWSRQLMSAKQLFFPFYPLIETGCVASEAVVICDQDELPQHQHPCLPF